MEFFNWVNVVQVFTEYYMRYFMQAQAVTAAGFIESLRNFLYISIGVAGGLYLVCLVLGGLGMRTMAKRAGLKHSFLAFLPFANTYYAGKLAGETAFFGKKMKRAGLYAMLAEIVYVAIGVFALIVSIALYTPDFWAEQVNGETGQIVGVYLDAARIPVSMRWLTTAQIVCDVLSFFADVVLILFLCVMFYAFFRKYYARGPFLMTFMCALLPLRGIVIFAVRNNAPVNYEEYLRKRMAQYRQAQGGPNGGYGQGGYDGYGNRTPDGAPADDPFSDFGSAPKGDADGDVSQGQGAGGGQGNDKNDPFPDF